MAIVLRSVKGSNLTPTEVDANFTDLDNRVENLETNPPLPVSVSNVTVEGNVLSIHLTNATTFDFVMPTVRMDFRREWTPDTAYFENDVVTHGRDGFYAVLYNHISPSEWDVDATNDSDQLIYDRILGPFNLAAPIKTLSLDEFSPILDEANYYFRLLATCEVTIPSNASVAFDIGTELYFRQCTGAQPVNFIPEDVGVTIHYRDGYDSITDGQGAVVTFKKVAENEWDAFGAFALESST